MLGCIVYRGGGMLVGNMGPEKHAKLNRKLFFSKLVIGNYVGDSISKLQIQVAT
jgi:hypothetical protein